MDDDRSGSRGQAAVVAFVAFAFLCSGIPALVICGGMGASFTDILRAFVGS